MHVGAERLGFIVFAQLLVDNSKKQILLEGMLRMSRRSSIVGISNIKQICTVHWLLLRKINF